MKQILTPAIVPVSYGTNGFRLTLESGVAVSSSDQSAKTRLYLTPCTSNEIFTYDSSVWKRHTSAEIFKDLGTLSADKPYDVWVYWTGSALDLEFLVWTDTTNRATAIVRQDGVWVKSGDASRRYVGTFYTATTTTTEDSKTKRLVWNVDNRRWRRMIVTDTSNWSYSTATIRPTNNNTAHRFQFVRGLNEEPVRARALMYCSSSTQIDALTGIGLDSTTAMGANVWSGPCANVAAVHAEYDDTPSLGYHYLQWLEKGGGSGTQTWHASHASGHMQSGMFGEVCA